MTLFFYIFIAVSFLMAMMPCMAITPQDAELIVKAKEAETQWLKNTTARLEKGDGMDASTLEKLQEAHEAPIRLLILKAFEPNIFESENSLWYAILQEPAFNATIVAETFSRLRSSQFDQKRREKILDIIITFTFLPEHEHSLVLNINKLALVATIPDFMTEEQRKRIVTALLKKHNSNINLLHYEAFTPSFDAETSVFFEKLATNINDSFPNTEEGRKYWLAASILAHQGNLSSIAKLRKVALNIKSNDIWAINIVPLGLVYSRQPELIAMVFDMLKSDIIIDNGEDMTPSKTQLAHSAAASLSIVIDEFPNYDFYQKFTEADKKRCLEWATQHKNNYKIIIHNSEFFFRRTVLGL